MLCHGCSNAMNGQIHLHTKASDGWITPKDVLESGLEFIAVTDHDILDAVESFRQLEKEGIMVIPGIELTTTHLGQSLHMLIYYPEYGQEFLDALDSIKKTRNTRAVKVAENLERQGFYCPGEELARKCAALSRGNIADFVLSFEQNRKILAEKGITDSRHFMNEYISRDKPAYIPFEKIEFRNLAKLVSGIKVLAHPGYDLDMGKDDHIIKDLAENYGLAGIEANSRKHTPEETEYYNKLAKELGLVVTTSADAHRVEQLTQSTIDYSLIEKLKEKYARLNNTADTCSCCSCL